MLTASLLHVGSEAPIACLRPSEEKLAALALSISAERGEPPAKGPRQELYVGEIRDALMTHGPACPRCRGLDVVRYGKRGAVQRYKCKTCPCYFTDLTGSVLHRIRRRDRWLDFCLCMKEADLGEMDPIVRRNPIAYRRFFPECRQAALAVAVDRSGTARAGVALHGERLRDALSHMMSETADPCAFKDYASLPARMDWPGRVNWIGKRRGRFNASDRVDPGPLYHVRNARRVVYDFRCWLKPFRGVATKHLLRYFSWYVRIAAMAPARAHAAARLLFFEALAAYSLPRPG